MNDILPPKRPISLPPRPRSVPPRTHVASTVPSLSSPSPTRKPGAPVQSPSPEPPMLPAPEPQKLLELPGKPRRAKKIILWSFLSLLLLGIVGAAAGYLWYMNALNPVDGQNSSRTRVEIVAGSSPSDIAKVLQENKLIQSDLAFDIYTRLSDTRSKLQAGTYSLSPSESLQKIVEHLVAGRVDQFSMTFLPGATLAESRASLIKAGYSEGDVDLALNKKYDHPLFESKPAGANLEGYIYGETYSFESNASVEQILKRTFDEYYKVVKDSNLVSGYKAQGLTLYEGITLASIIQREVSSAADQKQVAQIFLSRLGMGMALGSDVTYQYAAKKLGVTPSPSLESPYNTRQVVGLPPGPIASPGLSALKAVAAPAPGDYVYFLSGDDNLTYYARTNEEHEANVRDHCKAKCLIP